MSKRIDKDMVVIKKKKLFDITLKLISVVSKPVGNIKLV